LKVLGSGNETGREAGVQKKQKATSSSHLRPGFQAELGKVKRTNFATEGTGNDRVPGGQKNRGCKVGGCKERKHGSQRGSKPGKVNHNTKKGGG